MELAFTHFVPAFALVAAITREGYVSAQERINLASSNFLIKSKKLSITCTKGKVTKKVTAVSPKCPTGYKKK